MLKKCYGLFLGLVVLAGSACVTPTHASSASVVITNIRAGSTASALEEGVVLYNNSSFEVVINDWCLTNKALVKFACIVADNNEQIILPAYSYATVVSLSAAGSVQTDVYAAVYESVNHSSGAIVASSDTISLLDATGELVDQYSWTSSITSTQHWARMVLTNTPTLYLDNNSASDWQKQTYVSFPVSQIEYRVIQTEEPFEEPEIPEEPTEERLVLPAIITEMLPNALGSDTGNEFIEIYNPNEFDAVSLDGYVLAVGPAFEKKIMLGTLALQPKEYKVLSNADYSYSLLNTSSRVSLTTSQGVVSSEVLAYTSPAEGEAWAFINNSWQYTNQPTPGQENLTSISNNEEEENEDVGATALKPCATNQYRSLETNRCRLLGTTTASSPVECKPGQVRNSETNRCRNVTTATSSACKEGQERNPETNRCRNIKQLTQTDFAVKGASTQQQGGLGWYMWAAIGGVVVLILGYGVWEWREELKKLYILVRTKFARSPN